MQEQARSLSNPGPPASLSPNCRKPTIPPIPSQHSESRSLAWPSRSPGPVRLFHCELRSGSVDMPGCSDLRCTSRHLYDLKNETFVNGPVGPPWLNQLLQLTYYYARSKTGKARKIFFFFRRSSRLIRASDAARQEASYTQRPRRSVLVARGLRCVFRGHPESR